MSDFLTRLAQRGLGSVPTVQPQIPSYFAPGDDLGAAAIASIDVSGGDPSEVARPDSLPQDLGTRFDAQQALSARQATADAGRGEDIGPTVSIEEESVREAPGAARNTQRVADPERGVAGFLKRLFKPKTADVVQLKQEISGGSPLIRPTATSHSPDGGDAVSPQPERWAGQSEVAAANPRSGANSLPHAAVSASRRLADRQGWPSPSEEAASALFEIQQPAPEGGPQGFAAQEIASVSPELPDIARDRPEVDAGNSEQRPPVSDRVFAADSQRAVPRVRVEQTASIQEADQDESARQTVSNHVFDTNPQHTVSAAIGDPARQVTITGVHEKQAVLTQTPGQDESARREAPSVTAVFPQAEPPGPPQASRPNTISPRVMAPKMVEPQFVREDRLTGTESNRRESPTIEVAIGRIEVQALTPPKPARQTRTGPSLSLGEYLTRRGRRQP